METDLAFSIPSADVVVASRNHANCSHLRSEALQTNDNNKDCRLTFLGIVPTITTSTMQENEDNKVMAVERPRLTSMQLDLKVIIGSNENGGIKEFWHYSPVLAYESGYVDTLLSTQVGAHQAGTITFPDVTPSQWELMMKFLRQPHLLRTSETNTDTVCELAVLYDKYAFAMGVATCDDFLVNELPAESKPFVDFDDLEKWIDVILLSQQANLERTFSRGKGWVSDRFEMAGKSLNTLGNDLCLTRSHIEKLVPVLKTIESDILRWFGNPDITIEVNNPMFPYYICNEAARVGQEAREEYSMVRVSFCRNHSAAGVYIHIPSTSEEIVRYRLRKNHEWKPFELRRCPIQGCWEIYSRYEDKVLYRCETGWVQFYHVPPFEVNAEWIDVGWEEEMENKGVAPYAPFLPKIGKIDDE